jgi:pimeloyl-ACP methyl ester carboxylesterase
MQNRGVAQDALAMSGASVKAAEKGGPMTPFVLIPGFSCTGAVYRDALDTLWPFGSVSIARPPGLGDIKEIARLLLDEAPPQFALAGFSMGGYIALEMLRQAPQRITRLCMISSMARPDNAEEAGIRREKIAFASTRPFAETIDTHFPAVQDTDRGRDAEFRALQRGMAEEIGKEAYIRHFEAILSRPDSRPGLTAMTLPVSVIVGDRDAVTPPEDGREIAALFPNARFRLITDAGHFALMERHVAVGEALVEWART